MNALLRPHPPGVPLTDAMTQELVEHLLSGADTTPAEHAAWAKLLTNVIRMTEQLHEIGKPR
jgi:hypothetical protein